MIIKKEKWVGIRVTEETLSTLKEIADKYNESVASTVRKIIKYYLELKGYKN